MAITESGLFVPTVINMLTNTVDVDLSSETRIKVALVDNSITPNFDTHDYWADLVSGHVTGTNWTVPQTLTTTTLTPSSGLMLFDAADVVVADTTIGDNYGCVIYDDDVTTPTADAMVALIYYGGLAYPTNNGTYTIEWASTPNRIFSINCTP